MLIYLIFFPYFLAFIQGSLKKSRVSLDNLLVFHEDIVEEAGQHFVCVLHFTSFIDLVGDLPSIHDYLPEVVQEVQELWHFDS